MSFPPNRAPTRGIRVRGVDVRVDDDSGLPQPTGKDGTPTNFVPVATAPCTLTSMSLALRCLGSERF